MEVDARAMVGVDAGAGTEAGVDAGAGVGVDARAGTEVRVDAGAGAGVGVMLGRGVEVQPTELIGPRAQLGTGDCKAFESVQSSKWQMLPGLNTIASSRLTGGLGRGRTGGVTGGLSGGLTGLTRGPEEDWGVVKPIVSCCVDMLASVCGGVMQQW